MKVDPNLAIGMVQEFVLCEDGALTVHDGGRSPKAELADPTGAFQRFCRSLDPNRCFIAALIPDDVDREVFFAARDIATSLGLHMQATVDTTERYRAQWERYVASKRARPAPDESPRGETAE